MRNREPVFGANAKPFFIQAAVAIVVLFLANTYLAPAIEPWARATTRFIFALFE